VHVDGVLDEGFVRAKKTKYESNGEREGKMLVSLDLLYFF
jgi:hypothetical protein